MSTKRFAVTNACRQLSIVVTCISLCIVRSTSANELNVDDWFWGIFDLLPDLSQGDVGQIAPNMGPEYETLNASGVQMMIFPGSPVRVIQHKTVNMSIFTNNQNDYDVDLVLSFDPTSRDTTKFIVDGLEGTTWRVEAGTRKWKVVPLLGVWVGRAKLTVTVVHANNSEQSERIDSDYAIWGYKQRNGLKKLGLWGLMIGSSLSIAAFAAILPPGSVGAFFSERKLITLMTFCQHVIMPLLAWCLGVLFRLPGAIMYGLVATGCAPGNAPSVPITKGFEGDMNTSVVMTLFSTALSFITFPFWLYTIGGRIHIDNEDYVMCFPWEKLFFALIGQSVPAYITYVIGQRWPRAGVRIAQVLQPLGVLISLVFAVMVIMTNMWVYPLVVTWRYVMAGALLGWLGFAISYPLSYFAFRQTHVFSLTLAIETAVQNPPLAIVLAASILAPPDRDYSYVCIFMYSYTVIIPVLFLLPVKVMYDRFEARRAEASSADAESSVVSRVEPRVMLSSSESTKELVNEMNVAYSCSGNAAEGFDDIQAIELNLSTAQCSDNLCSDSVTCTVSTQSESVGSKINGR